MSLGTLYTNGSIFKASKWSIKTKEKWNILVQKWQDGVITLKMNRAIGEMSPSTETIQTYVSSKLV